MTTQELNKMAARIVKNWVSNKDADAIRADFMTLHRNIEYVTDSNFRKLHRINSSARIVPLHTFGLLDNPF
jgi:hypothetical protein